jgi:hypothetical protein
MSNQTPLDEIFPFLDYAQNKGFINKNTVLGRRTACNKLFSVLDPEQKSAEYLRDHMDVVKKRYQNLNAGTTGLTIDEYARRVIAVLTDFFVWKEDRGGWERQITSKSIREAKKIKKESNLSREECSEVKQDRGNINESVDNEVFRHVTFPLRADLEGQIRVPRKGLSKAEVMRYLMVLLSHCSELHDVKPADVEFLLSQHA